MVGMGVSVGNGFNPLNLNAFSKAWPHFGAVKLVIQSKTFESLDGIEAQEAETKARLQEEENDRPAGTPAKTAAQLQAALIKLVGAISHPQVFKAQAEEKFRTFIQQMKALKGADYQALFLHLGRKTHPRDRARTVPMRLLIDGEDLQQFQQKVWQQAYFSSPESTVFDAEEYGSGKRLERAFDALVRDWAQTKINDYSDGDRKDLIDLNAMDRDAKISS
jgi:hypothetical protein